MQGVNPTVWLLTDFGVQDAYVGTMKAVIKSISPQTEVYDLTHGLAPQQIAQAAFVLEGCLGYLPNKAVVVAVVDPGVGSARKAIAVRTTKHLFVAPDNGLLTPVLKHTDIEEIVALNNVHYWLENQSDTFHGRDLFSPVGAHLAAGAELSALGDELGANDCVLLPQPTLEVVIPNQEWLGEVVYTDGFGNLITSLPNDLIDNRDAWSVTVDSHRIDGIKRTFSDVPPGQPVVYTGSAGRLEVGVCNGNAASQLSVSTGASVGLFKRQSG